MCVRVWIKYYYGNYFNYPLCENAISRVDCNRMKIGKTIIQHRNIHLLLFTRHRKFGKRTLVKEEIYGV